MPAPFERPAPPPVDTLVDALERGHRARNILALGVSDDLWRRQCRILRDAMNELRGGVLTPDRAFMHIACINALARYDEELQGDIEKAQRAAEQVHAEDPDGTEDGDQ